MLRNIIKKFIPSQGDKFFDLFEEAAINARNASEILCDILNCHDSAALVNLATNSRIVKQKANDINKNTLHELNRMFITPIDRGDIQSISGLLNKLTKRIVKIGTKLTIYNIDATSDDCLIKSANTLRTMTRILGECIHGLKTSDVATINASSDRINELEENGIEDFRHAMNEIYSGKFETLMILKLKEIYKSIDTAIETSISITDLVLQVSIKSI